MKKGQLWDIISTFTLIFCLFCYSPWKREFSDLFKTTQTFINPIIISTLTAVQSAEILHFCTFFTFPEISELWTSGIPVMNIRLINVWVVLKRSENSLFRGLEQNKQKINVKADILSQSRPIFHFCEKNLRKNLSKKIHEIFFLQFFFNIYCPELMTVPRHHSNFFCEH